MKSYVAKVLQFFPVLLLLGLVGFGVANALQQDAETPDRGPQPQDFLDEAGEPDITGYLIGNALYAAAPNLDVAEPFEFRVFGCTEGSPITISFVPRVLVGDEGDANDALADDDETKLIQEPLVVVDEAEALADGSAYEIELPDNVPLGFARLRVNCAGEAGAEIEWDTVIDLVDIEEFNAAQENLDEDEEPDELSTTIDSAPVPTT